MVRESNKNKRIRTYALLAAVAVLAIALGVLLGGKISGVLFSGQDLFMNDQRTVQATPAPIQVSAVPIAAPTSAAIVEGTPAPTTAEATNLPSAVATADPYEELAKVADTSMMNGIVNIMFIGVDYEAARIDKQWSGKGGNSFHSDVMIVCAVNFNENRVDLISLPRDTYANIPGVKGIYKLNAALNCGTDGTNYGIFCEHGEGFEKVCEAAEWMLGGIDVDYYYAVTMESVKQIVDIVGGVWYNLEGDFDNGGRYYKAGFQHMNGQACLDYMRVRKDGHGKLPTGDGNRVKRQKNMMVAIFKKMKEENLVLKVPELISAFDGALFTNCSLEQTAALALFGYKLDPENIGVYSMYGKNGDTHCLFHWNFCFTDQDNRVSVIKKVYGVDTKIYPKYTLSYGRYAWCKMLKSQYLGICDPLKNHVQKLIDEDDRLYLEATSATSQQQSDEASGDKSSNSDSINPIVLDSAPSVNSISAVGADVHLQGEGYTRRYSEEQRALFSEYKSALKTMKSLFSSADSEAKKAEKFKSNSLNSVSSSLLNQMIKVQDLAIEVAKQFNYTKVKNIADTSYPNSADHSGPWALNYWDKRKYNEIQVNFN